MKYKNMQSNWNNDIVSMTLVCSVCGKEVDEGDKFCSKCGHKLNVLKKHVSKKRILELINGNEMQDPVDESIVYEGRDDAISTSGTTLDSSARIRTVNDAGKIRHCIRGYSCAEGCPLLSSDGYCKATVLTSSPPQYQRCSFSDSGPLYKFCKDVGHTPDEKALG